jgi:hypothetical protein
VINESRSSEFRGGTHQAPTDANVLISGRKSLVLKISPDVGSIELKLAEIHTG